MSNDEGSTFYSWKLMIDRCENKDHPENSRYEETASVCDSWKGENGFKNFIRDMGERPEGRVLGRIDNSLSYYPKNCNWITRDTEIMNRVSSLNGADAVRVIIQSLGQDPNSEHLLETPLRVVKSWKELYSGYTVDPKTVLGTHFEEGTCKEMVISKDISYYSMCTHHMLPFFGKVHFGYLPNKKVVGLSKIARLVEVYARRLQIQEQLTSQIANTFMEIVEPNGCMVVVEGEHLCMASRGVQKTNSVMVTSAIRGSFEDSTIRSEFLSMIGRK